ncbi:hypothetical protein FVE85_8238 [Porphyridium purpureum]|uniref:Transmembrane protein 198 n=1 Tax=Porphyridium purpureum TaxID=35688 RepID=A0A5J4YJZ4_PORPP|nr:hypothetical protein FVE85_8238 [Porphyridium purpureum]|eukprot:POR7881..scf244_11
MATVAAMSRSVLTALAVLLLLARCVPASIPSLPGVLTDVAPNVEQAGTAINEASLSAFEQAKLFLHVHARGMIGACIPLGLVVMCYGYFVLYAAIFLVGFSAGAFIVYFAVLSLVGSGAAADATGSITWVPFVAAILGGICSGLLALYLIKFGVFLIGAALGVVVALAADSIYVLIQPSRHVYLLYLGMIVLALLFGLLALRAQVQMMILFTAFFGAFLALYGTGYFLGHFPAWTTMNDSTVLRDPIAVLYLVLYVALGSLGCAVQLRILSRKTNRSRDGGGDFMHDGSGYGKLRVIIDDDDD